MLDTAPGQPDPSAVRALVLGTILIYNGSIAFAITGLFLFAAGWLRSKAESCPKWTGLLAYTAAGLCVISVPAMYGGAVNANGFCSAGGWGPAIIANFPPLFWFLAVGILLVRKARNGPRSPASGATSGGAEVVSFSWRSPTRIEHEIVAKTTGVGSVLIPIRILVRLPSVTIGFRLVTPHHHSALSAAPLGPRAIVHVGKAIRLPVTRITLFGGRDVHSPKTRGGRTGHRR